MMSKLIVSVLLLVHSLPLGQAPALELPSSTVTLNPAVKYQTISGWEATSQSGALYCPGFNQYSGELFDRAVNDLGINRLRLEISSGVENPVDYFSQYQQGTITYDQWKQHRYEIVNDNNNPNQINPAGFQFSHLDQAIDSVVTPMRQLLAARGETLFVNLNYVDFGGSAFEHKTAPDEYGEFVLAAYRHIQGKYGWKPDAWEVVLEPENAGWGPEQIGDAISAAALRLQGIGVQPYFIAPSTTSMGNAPVFFDRIILIPGVQPHLRELSYHRYSGVSAANLQAIAQRAVQYGVATAMLEHVGSDYLDLHEDLKTGLNSAWQQYTLAFCSPEDLGGSYFLIDESDPAHPAVILGQRSKVFRQYFKFIRRGAVQIAANFTQGPFDPLAFINTNGLYTVVAKATQGGNLRIQGLPAGRYGIYYTTADQFDIRLPDAWLSPGQPLDTTIPAAGVITVHGYAGGTASIFLPVIAVLDSPALATGPAPPVHSNSRSQPNRR